jgi:hypothetical protein
MGMLEDVKVVHLLDPVLREIIVVKMELVDVETNTNLEVIEIEMIEITVQNEEWTQVMIDVYRNIGVDDFQFHPIEQSPHIDLIENVPFLRRQHAQDLLKAIKIVPNEQIVNVLFHNLVRLKSLPN